jgi:hypothetical protein
MYRLILSPDGGRVRQFVGWADNMGEVVRRAHEICEEAKNESIESVEVIDREMTPDVAAYRADRSKG